MNKKKVAIYTLLLTILITLFLIQSIRMHNQYSVWKGNYDFLDNENKTIESWMSVNLINKYFDIEYYKIFDAMDINDTFDNRRIVLDDYCKEKEIDCKILIEKIQK